MVTSVMEWSDDDSAELILRDRFNSVRCQYKFNQLRRTQQLCDLEVRVGSSAFLVHKVILASGSPYMLGLVKETGSVLELIDPQLDVRAVEALVEYIYTSTLRVASSNVKPLCYAARHFHMERIERACTKFMSRSCEVGNCVSYLRFARECEYSDLELSCCRYIARNFQSVDNLQLSVEEMTTILQLEQLAVDDQTLVESISRWTLHNPGERFRWAWKLFDVVRSPWLVDFCREAAEGLKEVSLTWEEETDPRRFLDALRSPVAQKHSNHASLSPDGHVPDERHSGRGSAESPSPLNSVVCTVPVIVVNDIGQASNAEESCTVQAVDDGDLGKVVDVAKRAASGSASARTSAGRRAFSRGEAREGDQITERDSPIRRRSAVEVPTVGITKNGIVKREVGRLSLNDDTCPFNIASRCAVRDTIYVAGGSTATATAIEMEKYSPVDNQWTQAPSLRQRRSHAALACVGNKLYLIGGLNEQSRFSSVDVYDLRQGTWQEGPAMPSARCNFGVAVIGNTIYCIAGSDGTEDLATVDILNLTDSRWIQGSCLGFGRSYVQAAVLDGAVYTVGGSRKKVRLRTVEKLGLAGGTAASGGGGGGGGKWETVTSLTTPRSRPAVASLQGRLYVAGGYSGTCVLCSVECYTPQTNLWTKVTNMSTPRNSPGAVALGGHLYVCGGYNGTSILSSCERYDPGTCIWEQVAPMNIARCNFSIVLVPPVISNTWL